MPGQRSGLLSRCEPDFDRDVARHVVVNDDGDFFVLLRGQVGRLHRLSTAHELGVLVEGEHLVQGFLGFRIGNSCLELADLARATTGLGVLRSFQRNDGAGVRGFRAA